jgi:hypothetical protein
VRLRGYQPARVADTGETKPVGSVALVDVALSVLSRREFFTPDEALALLDGVRARARSEAASVRVEAIVDAARTSYSDHKMLDRSRVVDPLLDIRLALGN